MANTVSNLINYSYFKPDIFLKMLVSSQFEALCIKKRVLHLEDQSSAYVHYIARLEEVAERHDVPT